MQVCAPAFAAQRPDCSTAPLGTGRYRVEEAVDTVHFSGRDPGATAARKLEEALAKADTPGVTVSQIGILDGRGPLLVVSYDTPQQKAVLEGLLGKQAAYAPRIRWHWLEEGFQYRGVDVALSNNADAEAATRQIDADMARHQPPRLSETERAAQYQQQKAACEDLKEAAAAHGIADLVAVASSTSKGAMLSVLCRTDAEKALLEGLMEAMPEPFVNPFTNETEETHRYQGFPVSLRVRST